MEVCPLLFLLIPLNIRHNESFCDKEEGVFFMDWAHAMAVRLQRIQFCFLTCRSLGIKEYG